MATVTRYKITWAGGGGEFVTEQAASDYSAVVSGSAVAPIVYTVPEAGSPPSPPPTVEERLAALEAAVELLQNQ